MAARWSQAESFRARFAVAGSNILFAANGGTLGYELFAMTTMASFARFGGGCPGTGNSVPQIAGAGTPLLGSSTFAITSLNGLACSAAVLQVGFRPASVLSICRSATAAVCCSTCWARS